MSCELIRTNDEIAVCEDAGVLLSSLKQCAVNILGNLERMAAILRRLDELGVEVSLDHALIPYIRMIANGQLSASCFIACAADPVLLHKAITLPIPAQEKIGKDEPFELVTPEGDKKQVKPSEMQPREVKQVFGTGFVRSADGQNKWLNTAKKRSAATTRQHASAPRRCQTCRARLIPGADCLKCKLSNLHDRSFHATGTSTEEPAEGWEERLEDLRTRKQVGQEYSLAEKLVDDLSRKHIGHLVRGLDAVAKANGGKGPVYKEADRAINVFIACLKQMSGGEK